MHKRTKIWLILLLLALSAGGLFAYKKSTHFAAKETPTITVTTLEFLASDIIQIHPQQLRQVLPISGELRAVNQATVKARVGGDVREVLIREGETVSAGQVLVKMDTREYQARLNQSQGALVAAQGQLSIASKARDNNQTLVEKGFISKNAFDNAASQFDIAKANVDTAKGGLDVSRKALGDTVIKAPISGLVSSRSVQPGEKVSMDNNLLQIVDLKQMELVAPVPTGDILNVAVGQDVQLSLEGLATSVMGKVTRINPSTEAGSRSILIFIQVDNPKSELRVGMFGEAQLTLNKKTDVLTVPQSALQTDAGHTFVYAIESGKLQRREVTLGMRGNNDSSGSGANNNAVEILSGLD
ncbi:MAG: efflux RND transporter periplasmic adaptor subunit, partial [Glaciimonas sp.]|nr:efflux RND transporter periplasmic adaptor subunit [Glaciimonas sp.]